MNKKNILPTQGQPVNRIHSGQFASPLAELSEEALGSAGAEASSGPLYCSYDGAEASSGPLYCSYDGAEASSYPGVYCSYDGAEASSGLYYCSYDGAE